MFFVGFFFLEGDNHHATHTYYTLSMQSAPLMSVFILDYFRGPILFFSSLFPGHTKHTKGHSDVALDYLFKKKKKLKCFEKERKFRPDKLSHAATGTLLNRVRKCLRVSWTHSMFLRLQPECSWLLLRFQQRKEQRRRLSPSRSFHCRVAVLICVSFRKMLFFFFSPSFDD